MIKGAQDQKQKRSPKDQGCVKLMSIDIGSSQSEIIILRAEWVMGFSEKEGVVICQLHQPIFH